MNKLNPSISVFFPCYNDKATIKTLIIDALKTLRKLTNQYEVIVIDDGSTDGSRNLLSTLAKQYKSLKVILHDTNKGYGGTLKSGFAKASYDLIFYTDGDGQYDVKELPILVNLMSDDVNFINGIKMARRDPTYRIVIGNLYSFVARWLFWLPILDVDCDFRLIRKNLIDKIRLEGNSGSICVELVKKAQNAGGKFRQVSIHHYERRFGNSQFFRLDRILVTFYELSILWLKLMIFR